MNHEKILIIILVLFLIVEFILDFKTILQDNRYDCVELKYIFLLKYCLKYIYYIQNQLFKNKWVVYAIIMQF